MNIIYFGTPSFSAHVLKTLLEQNVSIRAIVTQPDRPRGRSREISPSPVKNLAQQLAPEIPIFQPEKASSPASLDKLQAQKADLFVVVAYGQILSRSLLALPPLGCINVHASLLPKYRGAAPIQRCLMNGEKKSGVSIQKMVFELDAGDVVGESSLSIPEEMTLGQLEESLCELSKPLLLSVLREYESGVIPLGSPQDINEVTYAAKITAPECQIQWSQSAAQIHNLIRSLSPRPGAWTWVQDGKGEKKRLKILLSRPVEEVISEGAFALKKSECWIGCGDGALKILQVQPEGKAPMACAQWLAGYRNHLPCLLS